MIDYALMNQYLYEGKAKEVEEMTRQALEEGRPAQEILTEGLIAGMSVVGEDFKHNILYVPEVLIAARAMKAGMAYDTARPYFHPLVFDRLALVCPGRFAVALDVACGTGQSTQSLAEVSDVTVGLDASLGMLQQARQRDVIAYVQGHAECLPFPDATFDIVTVGLGLHWFDRERFLAEARRVSRRDAWLLVYDSGFCESMAENPAFTEWVNEYRQRFPAPPRDDAPIATDVRAPEGFACVLTDTFVHREAYDLEQLVGYLRTQSNVLVQLRHEPQAIDSWLRTSLRPFFVNERATLEYPGWMVLLRRVT